MRRGLVTAKASGDTTPHLPLPGRRQDATSRQGQGRTPVPSSLSGLLSEGPPDVVSTRHKDAGAPACPRPTGRTSSSQRGAGGRKPPSSKDVFEETREGTRGSARQRNPASVCSQVVRTGSGWVLNTTRTANGAVRV